MLMNKDMGGDKGEQGYHDFVGELVGEPLDEGDEGGVVGEEALYAAELGAAVGDGLGHPRHGPPRLLLREHGAQRRRRPLFRHGRCCRALLPVLALASPSPKSKPKPQELTGRGSRSFGTRSFLFSGPRYMGLICKLLGLSYGLSSGR